jgi:Uma2 family endonuclease
MALAKPADTWTYEDLLTLPDDGRRYEIIVGELYEMSESGASGATASGHLNRARWSPARR